MADRAAKTHLFDTLARVGMALGNGTRLELLDLLAQGQRSVDILARAAGLQLTTASAHLQILRKAGLVATRRDGHKIYYQLAGDDVRDIYARLRAVAAARLAQTDAARAAYLGPEDTAQISPEDLFARALTGQLLLIDVRPREEYAAGHIPGAICTPLDQLADHLATLPADAEIVAYCRSAYCVLAHDAVRLLTAHGHQAARLTDGMLEWRLANRPTKTDDPP